MMMRPSRVLFWTLAAFFLAALSVAVSVAAEPPLKKIEVTFGYTGQASAFRLYMDGQKICETLAGVEQKMVCDNIAIAYGVHMFTMTAIETSGIESNHSAPYAWTYAPVNGAPPTFINFSITVDGKTIPVGPLGPVQ